MDFSLLIPSIQKASLAALDMFCKDSKIEYKQDGSILTDVDITVNDILVNSIKEIFPNEIIISEESPKKLLESENLTDFFLVDPIDGTSDFIQKRPEWTINVAYIKDRKAFWGCISAPALEEMYYCGDGSDRKVSGIYSEFGEDSPTPLRVLKSISNLDKETEVIINFMDNRNEISMGSSIKFCYLAQGYADYYPRAKTLYEWDIAAGHAILKEAGGNVYKFGTKEEVLYGNKNFETFLFEAY